MQIPFSNLNTVSRYEFGFLNHISKLIPNLKKNTFDYTPQLSADKLIFLLEQALNDQCLVTIQCNVSLYTENVYELSGYLKQINNDLIIINATTQIITIVWPKTLRHIKFNN